MITIADSIGIKLITPECLLVGVGNELHQFNLDSNNQTIHHRFCLNFRSKIYGISSFNGENESKFVVVHGGRELAIFYFSFDKHLKLITRLCLNDWISSVQVYKPTSNDDISFCIVSAHSAASQFTVNMDGKWRIDHKASCTDKCTLYCSSIIGESWDDTTIFGGTAFGELFIWIASGNDSPTEVLQRIVGHNGVIFSIDCNLSKNLITTTSDDRSVKTWKLNFPNEASTDWSACSIEPKKQMFGHTARIMNHKIIEYNEKAFIITVGEDSNICIWSDDGRLVHREPIVNSVSIWNVDYDPSRQYLFACGNDGDLHQINLTNVLNETQYLYENIEIDDFSKGEHIKKLAIMQNEAIAIVMTTEQKLFYAKIEENLSKSSWKPIPNAETAYKITVLETYGSLVATTGYEFVTIYQIHNGELSRVYHQKPSLGGNSSFLCSLQFLTETEFVVCDDKGNGLITTIDDTFNAVKYQPFQMPPGKERWITVAARFENYLVVGDRHGNMHLYEISDTLALKHTLWHVHGNLGCKSIFQTTPKHRLQFESTGHQGKMKTIRINDTKSELELKSTHDIPIKWCDKSLCIDEHHNILLAGFNERHFIAWRRDNSFRFEYETGGGHRAWDLYFDKDTSKAHLFFVRSKSLNCVQFLLHDSTLHPFNVPKNNWHSKPCNTMRIIQLSDERFLIASGGDDNLLKFNEISMIKSDNRQVLEQHFDMVLHISNIRSIFALQTAVDGCDDKENWLIFSAGGRAQICVTETKIDQQNNAQFHEICDFMLRSSDLERKRTKQTQNIYFDPETRFMSLVAFYRENEIHLAVGCSDGYIRTFNYRNGSISLDISTFYGRCILHVYQFQFNDCHYLISMATDGLICFWTLDNFQEDSKPIFTFQHHDSGINSFDIFIGENRMFVATGGDDQDIVISILQLDAKKRNEINISMMKTVKFPYNHTAQVNGMKFSADRKYLYTASVDQTIMKIDLNDFSITQANYSCISDAKGLQIIDMNHILIYGCGMQVLNI